MSLEILKFEDLSIMVQKAYLFINTDKKFVVPISLCIFLSRNHLEDVYIHWAIKGFMVRNIWMIYMNYVKWYFVYFFWWESGDDWKHSWHERLLWPKLHFRPCWVNLLWSSFSCILALDAEFLHVHLIPVNTVIQFRVLYLFLDARCSDGPRNAHSIRFYKDIFLSTVL